MRRSQSHTNFLSLYPKYLRSIQLVDYSEYSDRLLQLAHIFRLPDFIPCFVEIPMATPIISWLLNSLDMVVHTANLVGSNQTYTIQDGGR